MTVGSGLPRWLRGKEFACQVEDRDSSQGQEDPLEKEMATHSSILALQDRGAWWTAVHGVSKSQT